MNISDTPTRTTLQVPVSNQGLAEILDKGGSKSFEVLAMFTESGSVYQIGSLIRSTKIGQVFHAYELLQLPGTEGYVRSPEELAVKIYNKQLILSMERKGSEENPANEMMALTLLSQLSPHPNVMAIKDLFSDFEHFFMIMPYMSGGDLLDVMERNKERGMSLCLTAAVARDMFFDLVSGLGHLHAHGIAHRDLSIENILYEPNSDGFTIIDLGMCLRMPKDETTGQYLPIKRRNVCGKKNYIAPEVWGEASIFDPMKCDIWAAGVILFMVLTSSAPLEQAVPADPHFMAIAHQRLIDVYIASRKNFVAVEDLDVVSIDEETQLAMDLIQKILQVDPDRRLTIEEILAHPWMSCESSA